MNINELLVRVIFLHFIYWYNEEKMAHENLGL